MIMISYNVLQKRLISQKYKKCSPGKSGGNISVLVLQEIRDVSIPNLFFIKYFELFTNTRETSNGEGLQYNGKKDLHSKIDT